MSQSLKFHPRYSHSLGTHCTRVLIIVLRRCGNGFNLYILSPERISPSILLLVVFLGIQRLQWWVGLPNRRWFLEYISKRFTSSRCGGGRCYLNAHLDTQLTEAFIDLAAYGLGSAPQGLMKISRVKRLRGGCGGLTIASEDDGVK